MNTRRVLREFLVGEAQPLIAVWLMVFVFVSCSRFDVRLPAFCDCTYLLHRFVLS